MSRTVRNRWTVERETVIGWVGHLDDPSPVAAAPAWAAELGVSRLAVVDARGELVEQEVADLGAVLAAAPFAAPVRHRPPLRVHVHPEPGAGVTITSCSDIWLPWCSARYEPDAEEEDLADNTALAARHTPRLNGLLSRLREVVEGAGGSWMLDRDATHRSYSFEVDDRGVLLDAQDPHERVSWEYTDVDGLGETLRRAWRMQQLDPPPPGWVRVLRAEVDRHDHPLRRADRASVLAALRRELLDLRDVDAVEVDTVAGRHRFTPGELA